LEALVSKGFRGTPKDFTRYIAVLLAVGLRPGDSVLDFGSSWGYGSWQLRQAGFEVHSYEVSEPRAAYGKAFLGCNQLRSPGDVAGRVRCLFTAHVIEHLPDPNCIWQTAAKVLAPDGLIVCFCPNCNPELESQYGAKRYHEVWGKVHPLAITPTFLQRTSERHGYSARVYTTPFDSDAISTGVDPDNALGLELCMIARQGAVPGQSLLASR